MLFYFVVHVGYIYIFTHSRHTSPTLLFFSVQTHGVQPHGCWLVWVSLAKAAQCLTVAAACSDGGLWILWRDPSSHPPRDPSLETMILTQIMGEKVTNWPRFFCCFVVLKGKLPLSSKIHPTCLYIIEGLSTGVWTENEKFINVCWQLLHSTPYPKVAGSFVATWSYKCHSATRHGVLHQVVAKQWFCAQHIAQALALAAQNAVPPAKLMISQSPCKRRGTCCW